MATERSFSDLIAAAAPPARQTCGSCSGCGVPLYFGLPVSGAMRAYADAQDEKGAPTVGDRSRLLQAVLQYIAALGVGVCARCMPWHETQAPYAEDARAFDEMVRYMVELSEMKPDPVGPLSVARKLAHG